MSPSQVQKNRFLPLQKILQFAEKLSPMSSFFKVKAVALGLLFCLSIATSAALAADEEGKSEAQPGFVYVNGARVIGVFGSNGPLTQAERVKLIQSRVDKVFCKADFDPAKFRPADDEFGTRIFYGEDLIMLVSNEEAQSIKISSKALALDYIKRLKDISAAYKQDTRPGRLALGVLGTMGGLLLLIFFISNLGALSANFSHSVTERVKTLRPGYQGPVVRDLLELSVSFLARSVFFFVFVGCLHFYVFWVLNYFPWTKIYGLQLLDKTIAPLNNGLHALSEYIPSLFVLMVICYLTYAALALLRFFFTEVGKANLIIGDFDSELAEPTYKIVKALTIFMSVVVAAPYLPGWDSPAFKQVGLFIGLLVSLGSTGAIGHLVAGVVLTYTRAFKIGDRVRIGEYTGDITERTLFTTRLKTIKNEIITIHNGQVITADIVNYSVQARDEGVILHTSVTIGYDAPWRQVHELLIEAAKDCPQILSEPAPFVLQRALNDFFVEYEINAYTKAAHQMVGIYSDLHSKIQDRFNEAGVEIMSPHYASLRDGNETTIPAANRKGDYTAPGFRIKH